MHVDLGIWDKLSRLVKFLLFIAILLGIAVWYYPLIQQNERLRKDILEKDAAIQQREETGKKLRAAFDSLRHDPKAIERLAREQFGYAKPGETVVRFDPPSGTAGSR